MSLLSAMLLPRPREKALNLMGQVGLGICGTDAVRGVVFAEERRDHVWY
ncbi:hypothetical protein [Streptomyces sp. NPDC017435]